MLQKSSNSLRYQTGSNEWYTPANIIERARCVMGGIDLDPASSQAANRIVGATEYYDEVDDGLRQNWYGNVWCNPPYGKLAKQFTERALMDYLEGRITQFILLLNSGVLESAWFQPLWKPPICILRGRLRFLSPVSVSKGPTHGSILVYRGPNERSFIINFQDIGNVIAKVHNSHRRLRKRAH
jgi:hypothetical protein